jgi:hypothetical protein
MHRRILASPMHTYLRSLFGQMMRNFLSHNTRKLTSYNLSGVAFSAKVNDSVYLVTAYSAEVVNACYTAVD